MRNREPRTGFQTLRRRFTPAKRRSERPSEDAHQTPLPTAAVIVECVSRDSLHVTRIQHKFAREAIDLLLKSYEEALKAAAGLRRWVLSVEFTEFFEC